MRGSVCSKTVAHSNSTFCILAFAPFTNRVVSLNFVCDFLIGKQSLSVILGLLRTVAWGLFQEQMLPRDGSAGAAGAAGQTPRAS